MTGATRFLTLEDGVLIQQCDVDMYRASGPGGQKRNKTSSAVRLRHRPTGLIVTSTEDRSQHVNKARALKRLREAIALHIRSTIELNNYSPSACVQRLLRIGSGTNGVRQGVSEYYVGLGELLDVLATCEMRLADAAPRLCVSTSRLVKIIRKNAKLWKRVNEMRKGLGVRPLR